jgi:hypothetical protein
LLGSLLAKMNNSARNSSDMHTYNKIGGWTTDSPRLYTFLAEYYASENISKKVDLWNGNHGFGETCQVIHNTRSLCFHHNIGSGGNYDFTFIIEKTLMLLKVFFCIGCFYCYYFQGFHFSIPAGRG